MVEVGGEKTRNQYLVSFFLTKEKRNWVNCETRVWNFFVEEK